jgi:hypothetical protein
MLPKKTAKSTKIEALLSRIEVIVSFKTKKYPRIERNCIRQDIGHLNSSYLAL